MAKIIPGASAQAVKKKQYLLLSLVAGAIVVLAVVAGYLTEANKKPALPVADASKPVGRSISVPGESLKEEQSWRAIEGARLEAINKEVANLRAEADAVRKELVTRHNTPAALPAGVVPPPQRVAAQPPPVAPANETGQPMPPLPPPPSGRPAPPGALPDDGSPRPAITTVSFEEEPPHAAEPQGRGGRPRPALARAAQRADAGGSAGASGDGGTYLPAGTFVSGVLLNGLDAPTGGQAQQNPHPVLIQLTGNAFLPNKMRAEVRGCFMTASAHGDLSSERALIRGDRITCIDQAGAAIDMPIRSYVVGPDGKVGIGGRVVAKSGKLLANAAIAGVLSGLAAVAESYATVNSVSALGSVQTIDSDKIPQYAAASGVQSAADKLAAWYLKMADQTMPTVEIPTGVAVDVVLQRGLALEMR